MSAFNKHELLAVAIEKTDKSWFTPDGKCPYGFEKVAKNIIANPPIKKIEIETKVAAAVALACPADSKNFQTGMRNAYLMQPFISALSSLMVE